jgi:hypothetical protein
MNAKEILKENQEKINWIRLLSNKNAKENSDKIVWFILSRNEAIFKY